MTRSTSGTPTRPTPPELQRLVDSGTVLLRTRKRDGTWVGSAVSLVADGDHGYFRTWSTAGKVKRMRNFPEVRVAPSTLAGKATGSDVLARVRRVDGEEERRARALLSAGFPVLHRYLVPWLHRLRGNTTVHYELVTLDQPEPRPTDASTGES